MSVIKKTLYNRSCFVPGCISGTFSGKKANKEGGERNPSLFKGPNVSGITIYLKKYG